jgi:hypothetical protein
MLQDGQPPYNSRAIIDACRPYEWIKDFPRVAEASPELLRQVESKWGNLFAKRPGPAPGVGGLEGVARVLLNGADGAGPASSAGMSDAAPLDMAAGEGNTY